MQNLAAVETCLSDIESASPFRFCFIVLGSPLQEMIARKLQERGTARGLALCVGASINYMTGVERRAPPWMRQIGFEWLFRLLLQPRRMAYRYLIRGPRILWLAFRIQLRLRPPGPLASDMIGNGSDSLDGDDGLKAAGLS
jgi:UDP-N-acetyl-D-mannosaminuronic acid transferase (WecB/TagA/CpsF family)